MTETDGGSGWTCSRRSRSGPRANPGVQAACRGVLRALEGLEPGAQLQVLRAAALLPGRTEPPAAPRCLRRRMRAATLAAFELCRGGRVSPVGGPSPQARSCAGRCHRRHRRSRRERQPIDQHTLATVVAGLAAALRYEWRDVAGDADRHPGSAAAGGDDLGGPGAASSARSRGARICQSPAAGAIVVPTVTGRWARWSPAGNFCSILPAPSTAPSAARTAVRVTPRSWPSCRGRSPFAIERRQR